MIKKHVYINLETEGNGLTTKLTQQYQTSAVPHVQHKPGHQHSTPLRKCFKAFERGTTATCLSLAAFPMCLTH